MLAEDVLLEALARELARSGIDPTAWALGWARLVPSVVLIPVFGLRVLPIFAQFFFALILAAGVAPALAPIASHGEPLLVSLLTQLVAGLPVALSAAAALWTATMAGNLIDELLGAPPPSSVILDSEASPLGILFGLAAAVAFLELGGPAKLAGALSVAEPLSSESLRGAALGIVQGIQLAVLVAGPLLAVVPFLELFQALTERAVAPATVSRVIAPLRALATLALVALLLDRFIEGIALWMATRLPVN